MLYDFREDDVPLAGHPYQAGWQHMTAAHIGDLKPDPKNARKHTPRNVGQIERKRLALEGVQVPVTARWNVDMLRAAGFTAVECFWRWMNFAAWVAVKRKAD